jgi:hypothetical protein
MEGGEKKAEKFKFKDTLLVDHEQEIRDRYGHDINAVKERVRKAWGRVMLLAVIEKVIILSWGEKPSDKDGLRMWNHTAVTDWRRKEWLDRAKKRGTVVRKDDGKEHVKTCEDSVVIYKFRMTEEIVDGPRIRSKTSIIGTVQQTPARMCPKTIEKVRAAPQFHRRGRDVRYSCKGGPTQKMQVVQWMTVMRRNSTFDKGEQLLGDHDEAPRGSQRINSNVPALRGASRAEKTQRQLRKEAKARKQKNAEKKDNEERKKNTRVCCH